jgi:hypothetical protein
MVTDAWAARFPAIEEGTEPIDIPLPVSYAIPSEIIAPYLEAITFRAADRPHEGA